MGIKKTEYFLYSKKTKKQHFCMGFSLTYSLTIFKLDYCNHFEKKKSDYIFFFVSDNTSAQNGSVVVCFSLYDHINNTYS